MPAVEGDHEARAKPFCQGDYGSIHPAEGKVRVLFYQPCDALPIGRLRRPNVETNKRGQELRLDSCAQARANQITGLGEGQGRNNQPKSRLLQDRHRASVVLIVPVDRRIERPGINDGDA